MTKYLLGVGYEITEEEFLDVWVESSGDDYQYERFIIERLIEKSRHKVDVEYFYFVGKKGVEVKLSIYSDDYEYSSSIAALVKGNKLSLVVGGDNMEKDHLIRFNDALFVAWALAFRQSYKIHLDCDYITTRLRLYYNTY